MTERYRWCATIFYRSDHGLVDVTREIQEVGRLGTWSSGPELLHDRADRDPA